MWRIWLVLWGLRFAFGRAQNWAVGLGVGFLCVCCLVGLFYFGCLGFLFVLLLLVQGKAICLRSIHDW